MKPALIDPLRLRRCVQDLPALPRAAVEALQALRSEDSSLDECAERLACDQALTVRTLQLANSAFYGMPGRVGSVRDAAFMLGRRTLSTMVTAAMLRDQFAPPSCQGFDFDAFWRHAASVALAARGIAREIGLDPELAFTAGLLHDIGLLALATYFPDELSAALAHSRAEDRSLDQVERPLLGCAHAEIGAAIVSHWRLPAELCDAVRHHHGPPAAPGNAPSTLADVVHVADAVAHGLDLVGVPDEAVPETLLPSWNRLALAAAPWQRIFSHTEEGVELLCEALDLHKEPACT